MNRLRLMGVIATCALSAAAQVSVVTYHNDNSRTGQNPREYLLSPDNVGPRAFGKRFAYPVDGNIYGQPLYLPSVKVPDKGVHNIVLVATGHNSVYAFDADDPSGANSQPLWQVSFLDPARGVTAVPSDDVHCSVISPELGVVGTPVIDADSLTLYAIAETKEPGPKYVFKLHALDAASGAELLGSPVEIQLPGFVPLQHKQRGALLLSDGVVYSTWSANCDLGSYHGWVMAHDAKTLQLLGTFNVSPGDNGGSFWNGGAGPAADEQGTLYVISANAPFNAATGGKSYGDTFLKLSPAPSLSVLDYFTPYNQDFLNLNDIDLGSSGAVLLPDEAGSAVHRHLLVSAGKEGRIYLLDRDSMGGAQSGSDSAALASLPVLGHSLFGSPAYFNGSVYFAPEYAPVQAYPVSQAKLGAAPSSQSPDSTFELGATPSVSSNGRVGGLLWILSFNQGGVLRSYDAGNLSKTLFDSSANPGDVLGGWSEFSVPTIADGKVFAGAQANLVVYGLVGVPQAGSPAVVNAASYEGTAISPGSLISLFGTGLSLVTAAATSVPLPVSLADVAVTVNGVQAPLLYVSPLQINAEIPVETAVGSAEIVVRVSGVKSKPVGVQVQEAGPGIFLGANGQAAAVNQDTSLNDSAHPARSGEVVAVFLTGIGPVSPVIDSGHAAPVGTLFNATLPVTATVGGVEAKVHFAGLAPGYPGVAQVNLEVPPQPASGNYPVGLAVAGTAAKPALLSVAGN